MYLVHPEAFFRPPLKKIPQLVQRHRRVIEITLQDLPTSFVNNDRCQIIVTQNHIKRQELGVELILVS